MSTIDERYTTDKPQPESAEQTDPAKLQIEEGKFYRNRMGEKIGPIDHTPQHPEWPWVCWETHESFRPHGESHSSGKQTDRDLIAPWTEPEAAGVEQGESTGYYIDGKEVTKLELYQHVGAKVFDGLRKGTLPGCSSEVMGLREQLAEARDRTKMDAAEIGELKLRVKELSKERDKLFNQRADERTIVDRWIEATGQPDPTTYKTALAKAAPATQIEYREPDIRECGKEIEVRAPMTDSKYVKRTLIWKDGDGYWCKCSAKSAYCWPQARVPVNP